MTEHQSSRTLVKSAPELWAECSDAASLARHLGAFGEIRITKLEPETTVAWEGAAASGTVTLETSGWGTRVTLTVKEEESPEPEPVPAEPEPEAAAPEPVAEPEPELEPVEPEPGEREPPAVEPAPPARRFGRFRLFRRKPVPVIEPDAAEPEPIAVTDPELVAVTDPEPESEPVAEAPPPPEPTPQPDAPPLTGEDALTAALESLGMAHHRPYSRA